MGQFPCLDQRRPEGRRRRHGRGGGRGRGKERGRARRQTVSNEICATLIDHILVWAKNASKSEPLQSSLHKPDLQRDKQVGNLHAALYCNFTTLNVVFIM